MDIVGPNSHLRLTAKMTTMAELCASLVYPLRAPHIIDKTALSGTYDFKLEFSLPMRPIDASATDIAPDIFTALQRQLGLKLDEVTARLDMLVIDHIERLPIDN